MLALAFVVVLILISTGATIGMQTAAELQSQRKIELGLCMRRLGSGPCREVGPKLLAGKWWAQCFSRSDDVMQVGDKIWGPWQRSSRVFQNNHQRSIFTINQPQSHVNEFRTHFIFSSQYCHQFHVILTLSAFILDHNLAEQAVCENPCHFALAF